LMKEEQETSDKEQTLADMEVALQEEQGEQPGPEEPSTDGAAFETGKAAEADAAAIAALAAENQKLKDQLLRLAAEFDTVGRSLKAQMKYADKLGARFVAIIGDEEMSKAAAVVKDMAEGSQREVGFNDLVQHIRELMGR